MERRRFIGTLAASALTPALPDSPGPKPDDQSAQPMQITILGTGTPAPSVERQSSGFLFKVGSDVIVMDHGPGAHQRLIETGHRAVEVTHALLTHLHYDHCMDYGRLVLQRWDQGAEKIPDLEVYGPTTSKATEPRRSPRSAHRRPTRGPGRARARDERA